MKSLSVSDNHKLLDSGMSRDIINGPQHNLDPENRISKKTLLVLDDDPGPRLSLKMVFSDEYHTMTASTAEEAKNLIETHPVHIAILDLNLPGQSGIDVFRELKKFHPHSEAIIYSGFLNLDYYKIAFREKIFECCHKPLNIRDLREIVSRADRAVDNNQRIQSLQDKLLEAEHCIEFFESKRQDQLERERIYAQMTHDLNSSIAGLSGYLDVITSRFHSLSDEFQKTSVSKEIRQALESSADHVNYAINLSRRYLNFLSFPSSNFNSSCQWSHIAEELQRALSYLTDFKGLNLVVTSKAELCLAIHPIDLLQCLTNLSNNAFQASVNSESLVLKVGCQLAENFPGSDSGPGSKTNNFSSLSPLPSKTREWFSQWWLTPVFGFENGLWAEISVEDNGPGIHPKALGLPGERTPQKNLRKNSESKDLRWGLGLKIVERTIREANGGIYVESKPGKGTRFRIFVPLAKTS